MKYKVNKENLITKRICFWPFWNCFSRSLGIFAFRSSRPEEFCKKCVHGNFAKFTGKHLCQSSFFNKVAWQRPATSLKKRLRHRGFTVNFVKFLRTPFLTEQFRWLLLCLVLEAARADCSSKNLRAYLYHVKIKPIFSKFSHSLFQMSSLLGPFLRKF